MKKKKAFLPSRFYKWTAKKITAAKTITIPRVLHRPFLQLVLPLLLIALLTGLSACASEIPTNSSSENRSTENDTYPSVSLEDFKVAASAYGTVIDMTEQLTYESAAVQGNSQYNIIYMKADTPQQAERILVSEFSSSADSDDSAYSDSDNSAYPDDASSYSDTEKTNIRTLRCGVNYCYYEEDAPADPEAGTAAFYGRYLRVDNVLLLVTGTAENKAGVKETSAKLFQLLGYAPQ